MSDRFYTAFTVSGPNAANAEKAAIQALKHVSKDDKPPKWSKEYTSDEYGARMAQKDRGFYYDEDTIASWENGTAPDGSHCTHEEAVKYREKLEVTGPDFFDHYSGQAAVEKVATVSRQYPTETFTLLVRGGFGEGQQGPVFITDGKVRDGRTGFISYGDAQEPLCERCYPQGFKAEDLLPIDCNLDQGQVACPKCHTLYEYIKLKDTNEYKGKIEWYKLYEISAEAEEYAHERSDDVYSTLGIKPL